MKNLKWCAGAAVALVAVWLFTDSPLSGGFSIDALLSTGVGISEAHAVHPGAPAASRASPPETATAQAYRLDPDPYQNQAKGPADPIATF
jgi:hypothetical protein